MAQPPVIGTVEKYATASDGTPLNWLALLPDSKKFPLPRPVALAAHGGGFTEGSYNTPMRVTGADLAAAGYVVFAPNYRLAPPGKIPGQKSDGRYPDQTDDIELAVNAALADKRCNGSVQFVGGSGGGYLGAWFASKRKLSGVLMSPATSLDNATDRKNDPQFAKKADNYAPGKLAEASPLTYVDKTTAEVMVVAYEKDQMPPEQYNTFTAKLTQVGVKHEDVLLPGKGHSFAAWPTIKTQAIAFLDAHQVKPKPKLKRWATGTYGLLASNHTIDKEVTLAFPYITGYRIRTGWEDVQPKLGSTFSWDYIDGVAAVCRANGKKFSLGVSAGVAAPNPETWTVGGAEKFTLSPDGVTIENQEPDMCIPWDPKFQALWFPVIDAMGERYDSNPDLGYIVISGIMQLMEGRLVVTAGDLARMEDAAQRYGFGSFSAAYADAAHKTLARYIKAFPTTQVMLTTANVAPNGLKDGDAFVAWGKVEYPVQFGTMTAGLHAVRPPYAPPPVPPLNFPKGDQPIFNAGDHERFYGIGKEPVPWPPDPEPIQDLYGSEIAKGGMYIETYLGDCKKTVNAQAITDGNVKLAANAAGQPA